MSFNKSYRHARTAKRRAARELESQIILTVFGIALIVLLIGAF